MLTHLRPALTLLAAFTLVTGFAYPLAVTGVAGALFPAAAGGSFVRDAAGRTVGSSLIGQEWSAGDPARAARWFWGRPSATAPAPYTALDLKNGTGSSGSNLAPSNPALAEAVAARVRALDAAEAAVGYRRESGVRVRVPVDLVTASASGLDPHISPAAAGYQAGRVAAARGLPLGVVQDLVARHTTGRVLGILGEPVVNVLELNLELEALSGAQVPTVR